MKTSIGYAHLPIPFHVEMIEGDAPVLIKIEGEILSVLEIKFPGIIAGHQQIYYSDYLTVVYLQSDEPVTDRKCSLIFSIEDMGLDDELDDVEFLGTVMPRGAEHPIFVGSHTKWTN